MDRSAINKSRAVGEWWRSAHVGVDDAAAAAATTTIATKRQVPVETYASTTSSLIGDSGILQLALEVFHALFQFVAFFLQLWHSHEGLLWCCLGSSVVLWVEGHGHWQLRASSDPFGAAVGRNWCRTVGEDVVLEGIGFSRHDELERVQAAGVGDLHDPRRLAAHDVQAALWGHAVSLSWRCGAESVVELVDEWVLVLEFVNSDDAVSLAAKVEYGSVLVVERDQSTGSGINRLRVQRLGQVLEIPDLDLASRLLGGASGKELSGFSHVLELHRLGTAVGGLDLARFGAGAAVHQADGLVLAGCGEVVPADIPDDVLGQVGQVSVRVDALRCLDVPDLDGKVGRARQQRVGGSRVVSQELDLLGVPLQVQHGILQVVSLLGHPTFVSWFPILRNGPDLDGGVLGGGGHHGIVEWREFHIQHRTSVSLHDLGCAILETSRAVVATDQDGPTAACQGCRPVLGGGLHILLLSGGGREPKVSVQLLLLGLVTKDVTVLGCAKLEHVEQQWNVGVSVRISARV
mmetsp:Transcript_25308/g.70895  ORF Transcript_25308/g.70895 Transcript_25308/m.70895 type:complete len:519 (+) Transcript_25308:65-1621(+)